MTCIFAGELLFETHSQRIDARKFRLPLVYVCNCNGIRERDVHHAIACGASRPKDVFDAAQCRPQCARCVCEIREMIDEAQCAMAMAAE